MHQELSFGIIPLKIIEGTVYVLLVQLRSGNHWSFPKGHANANESPFEAAERELFEETGLSVERVLNVPVLIEHYMVQRKEGLTNKTVSYFPAYVKGTITLQSEEIIDSKWVKLTEAAACVTYPESKRLCALLCQYGQLYRT